MPPARLTLRVPGKLMIAGEYAVLEPHQPAVVVAVDRYMTATVALAPDNRLSMPGLGLTDLSWFSDPDGVTIKHADPRLRFVKEALTVALGHVRDQFLLPLPIHLTLESELDDDATGRKLGLGSSAAVVVAVVSAVLYMLHDDDEEAPPADLIFKLSAIAHLRAQGSGSGADVAASVYGGWIRYSSFNAEWLQDRLQRQEPIERLIAERWPFLSVRPIVPDDEGLCLCVGWTGQPASTPQLLTRVRALRDRDPLAYGDFLAESHRAVDQLVEGLETGHRAEVIEAIALNRTTLSDLGSNAGVAIETDALFELNRWAELCGGAAKPSGAGGGDCGVALIFGEDRAKSLEAAWKRVNLEPLRLQVSPTGVEVTETEW